MDAHIKITSIEELIEKSWKADPIVLPCRIATIFKDPGGRVENRRRVCEAY
jgi:hypothetical protein